MRMKTSEPLDALIIGAGPAGCSTAALLAEQRHRVLVLEREKFPRYHVGESLIPFTYGPMERLGLIPRMKQSHFTKKFSVDVAQRFDAQFAELQRRGLLTESGDWLVLDRSALLKIDVILHAFFLPQHQNARYT